MKKDGESETKSGGKGRREREEEEINSRRGKEVRRESEKG